MDDSRWLPQIDSRRCAGNGDCVAGCPTGALALVAGKATLARPEACVYCADCEALCRQGAISLPYLVVEGDES